MQIRTPWSAVSDDVRAHALSLTIGRSSRAFPLRVCTTNPEKENVMEIDFNQVRAAAHDDITAKILREKWQLDDRHSANGEVTCSRTDIENMLKNGQLEPVLSVEQFMSISRGKAYGNTPMPSQVRTPTASHDQPAADGTNWAGHPDWQEYQSLSDSGNCSCTIGTCCDPGCR